MQEFNSKREFYKKNDLRPPYNYRKLICQSIIESPRMMLTFDEILNWIEENFLFFKNATESSWKV
jgi:hypothetical protein